MLLRRALPGAPQSLAHSFPIYEMGSKTCDAHGRGGGVGRTLGVGKRRGVDVGLGVGDIVTMGVAVGVAVLVAVGVGLGVAVTVAVAVAVAVAVGVGVEEAKSAQYLPPVFRPLGLISHPPHTIISLPVQTAV